jgi:penicillin-binding protein 1C
MIIVALLCAIPVLVAGVALIHGMFDIRLLRNDPSLFLVDRSYRFIAAVENRNSRFGYWEMPDSLPSTLVMATLAAEDRRFWRHAGIDLKSVGRAVVNNYVRHNGYSGASTIAMQLARLQRGGGSSWYSKIRDAVSGLGVTLFWGRERVLRQYFMLAPYGNQMAGAACAARRYFHKPVQDLSFAEAALLASIPRAPSRLNLFSFSGFARAQSRARLIIKRAFEYGWIAKPVRDEALAELATFAIPRKELRNESCFHFIKACARRIPATTRITGEIRTTLDLDIQEVVQTELRQANPYITKFGASNAAALVADVKTGEVIAYVGAIDYYDPAGGAIDCADIPRSTGSLLKPFIYAMGMEWLGYTPATVLTDVGFDFGVGPVSFVPENCDRKFLGPVLYKCALANSRNIPAVQVLRAVGVERFYRTCAALGLAPDDGKAQYYGLGLSIGGLYCTLQQLGGAYLTLANDGAQRDLVWTMDTPAPASGRQVISPDIARQIRRFLADPVARLPTFPCGGNLEYPFAVALKTGTSEGYRDSWCFAWSDRYLAGVWVGNTDFSSTKNLTGYTGAAHIVQNIMRKLHADQTGGLDAQEFAPSQGYVPVQLCRLTGKRAGRFTPYTTTEYFRPGTEPVEYSTVQQMLPVDPKNGLLAYPGCTKRVEYRRFLVLAPEFSDWAASQGLEVPPDRYSPACGGIPLVDTYEIAITGPRNGARIFIDPEMPAGSVLSVTCRVFPPPKSVLWLVNDQEVGVAEYPFTLRWPMKPGTCSFQAAVPGTPFKSAVVRIEVF